jgi:hypothetical protein
MKSKWFSLIALIVLMAGCHPAAWKEFTSGAGQFSVLMPGEPTEGTQNVDTPFGPIAVHTFMVELKNKDVAYVTGYSDYPEAAIQAIGAEKALDGARDGVVSNIHGRLIAESFITLQNKYPGRDIKVEARDGKHAVRNRVYLVKNRLYQVLIVTNTDGLLSNDAVKFLDSFKLQGN